METVLTLENITLRLGEKNLVRKMNLKATRGEVITLTGPSGSGKSTLLRLLAGLIPPASGTIQNQCGKTAIAFQTPRLLPWRRAWKNVAIPLEAIGFSAREAREKALSVLEALDLKESAEYWPGALSGGMAHRVSLARALAVEPDLLLLDEPMNGLDAVARERALTVLQEHFNTRPGLCFYVTHNTGESAEFSRRTLALDGRGDFQEFLENPKLVYDPQPMQSQPM